MIKRPWKNLEDLKDEEWELKTILFSLSESFKLYLGGLASCSSDPVTLRTNSYNVDSLLDIAKGVERYGDLIKRIKRDLDDVREEIKEREDEENKITADNL